MIRLIRRFGAWWWHGFMMWGELIESEYDTGYPYNGIEPENCGCPRCVGIRRMRAGR